MPALSPTMSQGNLVAWHVKVGQEVAPGDVLADVETDKATLRWVLYPSSTPLRELRRPTYEWCWLVLLPRPHGCPPCGLTQAHVLQCVLTSNPARLACLPARLPACLPAAGRTRTRALWRGCWCRRAPATSQWAPPWHCWWMRRIRLPPSRITPRQRRRQQQVGGQRQEGEKLLQRRPR